MKKKELMIVFKFYQECLFSKKVDECKCFQKCNFLYGEEKIDEISGELIEYREKWSFICREKLQ